MLGPRGRRRAFTLMLLLPARAVFAFEGKILLPDGSPAADVTVSVVGRPGTARTDRQGAFRWEPDPPTPFAVVVVLRGGGFSMPAVVESIPADGPVVIPVTPASMVESVSVVAEVAPHIESPAANAVSSLSSEDLAQRRPERLVDALEYLPGAGRLGGGHEAVPSIRGLARGRTLLLLDGTRVTSERRAGSSATFLDPAYLEAVEVSRGPGSVVYGSDALGGVILARSPRALPGSPLQIRLQGSLGGGVPEAGGGIQVSRGMEEGGFLLQARGRDVDDFESPSGIVENSSAEFRGLFGRFDHEAGPGTLSVLLRSDGARDVERPASNSGTTRVSQPREDSDLVTVIYETDPLADSTLLGFQAWFGGYRLVTEQEDVPTGAIARSDVRARDFGLRATGVRFLKDARLEGGVDLHGRLDLEASDETAGVATRPVEDADLTDAAIYGTGEKKLSARTTLGAGVRANHVSTRNHGGLAGDRSTGNGAVSGFAALTAGPFAGVTVTGQVSRGFREPTLSDRYFTGPSGRGFVNGNPDLTYETSLQGDMAVRWAGRKVRAGLFVYDYRIDDLIERFSLDADPDVFYFRNRGEARLRGAEVEVHVPLPRGMAIELGAQTARGRADDGSDLADVPGGALLARFQSRLGPRGDLQVRTAVYERDDHPGPSEAVTPGHAVVDLGGGWRWTPRMEMRLRVRNVLDREYPASADARAAVAAGRAALLTFTVRLGG